MIAPERFAEPWLQMWLDEGMYTHHLVAHPNVQRWIELVRDPAGLVREHVDGATARELLTHGGALPVHVAAYIAAELAAGLAAVHAAELVHRHVGIETIACSATGDVKLIELGGSRLDGRGRHARFGLMSPEQVMGKPLDASTDVFSLGATLYTLLCGRAPFHADSDFGLLERIRDAQPQPIGDRAGGIPAELAAIVHGCMARAPAARTQATEVEAGLRAFLGWFAPGDVRAELAALVTSRRSGSRSVPS